MNMRRIPTPDSRDDTGFSLVELLISAALIPLILSAAYMAFGGISGNYSTVQATSDGTGEAQKGLDTLVRELRQARQIQEGGGGFASATPSSCSFYVDADLDGTPELVTYYVDGTDLYRGVAEPAMQVYPFNYPAPSQIQAVRVMNIGGMTSQAVFTYYNSADAVVSASSSNMNTISAVGIHLFATRPSQNGLVSVDFTTKVKIRALFDSLS